MSLRRFRDWLAAVSLTAGLLFVLRFGEFAWRTLARQDLSPEVALWRARGTLAFVTVTVLAAAAVAVTLVRSVASMRLARGQGTLPRLVLAWMLAAPCLVFGALAVPGGRATAELDRTSIVWLVAGALVVGLALAFGSRPSPVGEPRRGGVLRLALGLLLAAGLPLSVFVVAARSVPRRSVIEVAREIVTDGSWEVVQSHPAFPPHAGVLTPVLDYKIDGGDLPSIIMPPPCEVRFEVRPEDGPVTLRAAAGVDNSFKPRSVPELRDAMIMYDVEVNGEAVFSKGIDPIFRGTYKSRRWRRVGTDGGLELEPGDVVTLRTRLERTSPAARRPSS